jgi:NADH:ubiquinone oxidoreductase subunit 6 (subunit J)
VYVGAISILFLFVVKMTQAGRSPNKSKIKGNTLRIDFIIILSSFIILGI